MFLKGVTIKKMMQNMIVLRVLLKKPSRTIKISKSMYEVIQNIIKECNIWSLQVLYQCKLLFIKQKNAGGQKREKKVVNFS